MSDHTQSSSRAHSIRSRILQLVLGFLTVFVALSLPAHTIGIAETHDKSADPKPSQESTDKIAGAPGAISRSSLVNFSDVANAEKQAPPERKALTTHEPLEPGEETEDHTIPAGAFAPSDAGRPPVSNTAPLAASPALSSSFQALADDNSYIPADTYGAVGPNHLMVTLNTQIAIQTRSGSQLSRVSLSGFWSGFGHTDLFDPRVIYDSSTNRWVFISLADFRMATSALLVGVSQTGDPAGNWSLYEIDVDPANLIFADYPSLGFNKDWIAVSANTFRVSDKEFVSSSIYLFNKAALYSGAGTSFRLFQDSTGDSLAAAATHDNTLSTLYLIQNWNGNSGGSGSLRLSSITGPPGSETLNVGIAYPSTPNPWDSSASTTNFAPQLGSAQKIDGGDSVVQNLVYRNGSLWCAQTIFLPAGGSPTRSAIQWWQLNVSGAIQQRGRIDDPGGNLLYSFPSIAVNQSNDVVIGYSRFSASQYAGASYSFRAAADPPNTLRDPATLKDGEASYYKTGGGSRNKWGDFSNTVVDPSNDTDFWTIQEYAAFPSGGSDRFGTWWGRIVPSSTPPPPPPNEIVLYASGAGVRSPNWQVVTDSTAAGGARIWNPDRGAAKITTPLSNPADYFEMSFNAAAGLPYHLWIRGKAQNDSPYNDSIFVQFSDSTDSGAAAYRIGTTSATTINLEDCLGCGLSGWGWQDNGWDVGVMGPNISFQSSGTHTIRVQVREDGLSIDQIVLSPSAYLTASPGPLRNDSTILPESGGPPVTTAPTVTSVSPNAGPTEGGTPITITGTGFLAGASVSVGGVAATNVVVGSASSITATTPPHAAGSVNVTVTNSDGQNGSRTNAFTYNVVAPMPPFGHVFIIVEENHSYSSVIGNSSMPYLNSLASRYGLATSYYANTHPSIGNYFWLTTGQNITNDSDFAGTVTADNIVRQLLAAGKTWKSYAESLPSAGYAGGDQYPYVRRHNPFAYISDVVNSSAQVNNLVPFSQFASDLSNNQLPNYSFIIPNQYNNAHDCTAGNPSCTDAQKLGAADNWLSVNVAPLLGSAVFQQDGVCVILFDESVDEDTANGGGQVAMLVLSSRAKPGYRSPTLFQHQSTMRMMAQALGLTILPGAAATAPSMSEFFDTSSSPTPSLSTVAPNSGAAAGGTSVTITGSGFAAGATVMIGGGPATNVNVLNSSSITCTTPAHSPGSVNVTVTNTNGRSGTLIGGFTYALTAETILLADDFNDNSVDLNKWIVGNVFSGFTDASVLVKEVNQRLEIGPLPANTNGSHYNGIRSAAGYDFTGSYCYVALVQPGASTTSADAMLTIGVDVNNYYRIYVESGSLIVQKRINGTKATLLTAPYDSVNHRYLRIRHDAASGKVVFETAPDSSGAPGVWTERYRESWNAAVALGGIQFELKAGTFTAESVLPGLVVFDNFKAARP